MFNEYNCPEPLEIGVSVSHLLVVMKLVKPKYKVSMSYNPSKTPDIMTIKCSSEVDKVNFEFKMKLMDMESERLEIPDGMTGWALKLPSKKMSVHINDMVAFGDTIALKFANEGLSLFVKGDKGELVIGLDDIESQWTGSEDEDIAQDIALNFALRYLKMFFSGYTLSDTVFILMGQDIPIMIKYYLGDNSFLSFYLAPQIHD